ncbi:hypothetical protein M0811_00643 [Anaeramoeba ignava]|uniref:Uncharacterized protein n=1 Tax=Anaeramoeba ignava TaxID=1746090 RepID=A0A9Q0LMU5_ANAIG|nr:hypothetical protein M0811_00643 [Anaeramoeba ignava]
MKRQKNQEIFRRIDLRKKRNMKDFTMKCFECFRFKVSSWIILENIGKLIDQFNLFSEHNIYLDPKERNLKLLMLQTKTRKLKTVHIYKRLSLLEGSRVLTEPSGHLEELRLRIYKSTTQCTHIKNTNR